jgi:hypothetical protein
MGVKAKMRGPEMQCENEMTRLSATAGRATLSAVNQEPLQMLSCTPPAALNVLLWPVALPKNRVGGSAAFSFVFTFQFIGETLDTPAENGGCGYDFASGVHKYLYAQDDPVNLTDPSGNEVAVYTHQVFLLVPPFRHANIRLYPDNTNDIPDYLWQNQAEPLDRHWYIDPKDGRPFITIGAGNDDDFYALTTHVNRDGDTGKDGHKNRRRFVVQPPGGLSNDQFIVRILLADEAYYGTQDADGTTYSTFPILWPTGYNSNSYVVGLLEAVTGHDYSNQLPVTAPGRGRPVPPTFLCP